MSNSTTSSSRASTTEKEMASKCVAKMQTLFLNYAKQANFQRMAGNCRVIDADVGRVKVEFDVKHEHTNPFETLHGGYTATLIDIVTTTALLNTEQGQGGVTVDLHVSYLSAAKVGDTVVVDAHVIKQGRTMAFTRANVYRKADNRLVATALHTKAVTSQSHNSSKSQL